MANEKRLICAKEHHLRVSKIRMTDLFPDWKELPRDVQEKLTKLGKEHERLLFEAPTVDAVEVVRCKDCRQSEKFGGQLFCRRWGADWHAVSENAFCSYGERREGE